MASVRISSSVITTPALRITCASPSNTAYTRPQANAASRLTVASR
jgi:hypothetical protein